MGRGGTGEWEAERQGEWGEREGEGVTWRRGEELLHESEATWEPLEGGGRERDKGERKKGASREEGKERTENLQKNRRGRRQGRGIHRRGRRHRGVVTLPSTSKVILGVLKSMEEGGGVDVGTGFERRKGGRKGREWSKWNNEIMGKTRCGRPRMIDGCGGEKTNLEGGVTRMDGDRVGFNAS